MEITSQEHSCQAQAHSYQMVLNVESQLTLSTRRCSNSEIPLGASTIAVIMSSNDLDASADLRNGQITEGALVFLERRYTRDSLADHAADRPR
jgi:Leucine-rich repeat (LRR) protein